jgi:hypothetical protein
MWKDSTSYSRGNRSRGPTAWSLQRGSIKVTVTCNHIQHRGEWVMHCYMLGIDTKPLVKCETAEDAQGRAIAIVRNAANTFAEDARHLGGNS